MRTRLALTRAVGQEHASRVVVDADGPLAWDNVVSKPVCLHLGRVILMVKRKGDV